MEYEIGPEETVANAVTNAVRHCDACDGAADETLFEAVDPDALDALFGGGHARTPRSGGSVSFAFSGCLVTVSHGEYLTVRPLNPVDSDH